MREIVTVTKVYKWEELTPEAQEHAIEELWDLNVEFDWWEGVYDDANQIGLKIEYFDLDGVQDIGGKFTEYAETVANLIIENHGEDCETYKAAENYLQGRKEVIEDERAVWIGKGSDPDEFDVEDVDFEDLDKEFLRELLGDYLQMLRHEYDYLTSEEAIIESIQANKYEFTEKGGFSIMSDTTTGTSKPHSYLPGEIYQPNMDLYPLWIRILCWMGAIVCGWGAIGGIFWALGVGKWIGFWR